MSTVAPESVGLPSSRLQRVSQWLQQQVSSERLAGAGVMLCRHGEIAHFETTGLSELETSRVFEKDTIVRIYSMTKPITTVAAMMLYEQGHFQLDDPVALHIPAFSQIAVWTGGDADIASTEPVVTPMTIRHLMTHTSGLTYNFMNSNVVDGEYRKQKLGSPSHFVDLEDWVKRLAKIPLLCQPGSQWNYSVSTDVLGGW